MTSWFSFGRGPQPRPAATGGVEYKKESPEIVRLRGELDAAYVEANQCRELGNRSTPFSWEEPGGRSWKISQMTNYGPRPAGATPGRDGYRVEVRMGDDSASLVHLKMANGGYEYSEIRQGNPVPWRELSEARAAKILQDAITFLQDWASEKSES